MCQLLRIAFDCSVRYPRTVCWSGIGISKDTTARSEYEFSWKTNRESVILNGKEESALCNRPISFHCANKAHKDRTNSFADPYHVIGTTCTQQKFICGIENQNREISICLLNRKQNINYWEKIDTRYNSIPRYFPWKENHFGELYSIGTHRFLCNFDAVQMQITITFQMYFYYRWKFDCERFVSNTIRQ